MDTSTSHVRVDMDLEPTLFPGSFNPALAVTKTVVDINSKNPNDLMLMLVSAVGYALYVCKQYPKGLEAGIASFTKILNDSSIAMVKEVPAPDPGQPHDIDDIGN